MLPALTTIKNSLAILGNLIGAALSRPRCAACDGLLAQEAVFCPLCRVTVMAFPTGQGPAFGRYGGALAQAIQRLKYLGRADLARPLGSLLCRLAPVACDVIVPVPLHPTRLLQRGYNQAGLLAGRLGRGRGIPVAHRALARLRDTLPQTGLNRSQRLHNLEGAFSLRQAAATRGRRVVLVDDVRTTGATLAACSKALSGAASITHLVLADRI